LHTFQEDFHVDSLERKTFDCNSITEDDANVFLDQTFSSKPNETEDKLLEMEEIEKSLKQTCENRKKV
jgi:hypothetical protein